MPRKADVPVIGVDIGGSKILSAVIDVGGNILAADYRPTQALQGMPVVVGNITDSIKSAVKKANLFSRKVGAIGLGAPGISNPETGIVFRSPNLPDWRRVPLREIITSATGIRTFIINDANAAALGELHYGAAQGARNFIYITISTGIGGGIIIDGNLYTGSRGMAGEIGHMVVEPDGLPCNCGGKGCWELYASGSAIARRAREEILKGKISLLVELCDGHPEKIDAPLIKKANRLGDSLARALIAESARYLAMGLGSLINIFNPEMIIIGGGYSKMGSVLLKPAFKQAAEWSYRDMYEGTRFATAALGGNSGILGAVIYARQCLATSAQNPADSEQAL